MFSDFAGAMSLKMSLAAAVFAIFPGRTPRRIVCDIVATVFNASAGAGWVSRQTACAGSWGLSRPLCLRRCERRCCSRLVRATGLRSARQKTLDESLLL